MSQESLQDETIPHGEEIVERFGGIRPMAAKLNVPVTTVQGWKKRDAIPAIRRDEILNAAADHNVNLKGLLRDNVANQNGNQSPPIENATEVKKPQRAQHNADQFIDMYAVRKAARRTSLFTTVGILAVLGGAGFLLFGGTANQSGRLTTLEGRVGALEIQDRTAPANNGNMAGIQKQVSDIATIIGGSVEQLSQMAAQVAAGSGAPLTQRLAVLEAQLSRSGSASPALTGMLGQLQNMVTSPEGQQTWSAAIEELRNVVNGLQGQMGNLDARLEETKSENTALAQSLAQISGRDLGAAAMLLALTQLRAATDRETPFTDDLALVRDLAQGSDPALVASIDKMAPYAQNGILSADGLKRELQASANDIISAKLRGENVSFKEKILGRLMGLFSIKKDGENLMAAQESAMIAKASTQLDQGDVAGAMGTLNALQGPAREAAQPWQNQAAATLNLQMLDKQMLTSVITKIKSATSQQSNGLSGVVNAGPINMAPAVTPIEPEQPVLEEQDPTLETNL